MNRGYVRLYTVSNLQLFRLECPLNKGHFGGNLSIDRRV